MNGVVLVRVVDVLNKSARGHQLGVGLLGIDILAHVIWRRLNHV
jgi:hypothetical protein